MDRGERHVTEVPEGIEWPRFDDGELVSVVPPFGYMGKLATRLCFDGGMWFLLDDFGEPISGVNPTFGTFKRRFVG